MGKAEGGGQVVKLEPAVMWMRHAQTLIPLTKPQGQGASVVSLTATQGLWSPAHNVFTVSTRVLLDLQ